MPGISTHQMSSILGDTLALDLQTVVHNLLFGTVFTSFVIVDLAHFSDLFARRYSI